MSLRRAFLAAGALGVLAAPSPALAAWSAPAEVVGADTANPVALPAFGGSIATGWLQRSAELRRSSREGFGPAAPLGPGDPYEKVWQAGASRGGDVVVLTVRTHLPTQRIRAVLVPAGAANPGPSVTISDRSRSASQPELDVAPDGTVVAAWQWHDRDGWKAQAAIRRPGEARFGRPQTLSPAAPTVGRRPTRPWIHVAAGEGGRGLVTWQIGGSSDLDEAPLHVLTAGADSVFGPEQSFDGAGGLADVDAAIGPGGAVQLAWLDAHFSGHEANSSLRSVTGTAGAPLGAAQVLSAGGRGTSSGSQVGAAFSDDGTATVAWAKPGANDEEGGALEVFTRPAGGAFGAAQTVAQRAEGLSLDGGSGASAVLSWMTADTPGEDLVWSVHGTTRPASGGPFAAEQRISDPTSDALWPHVAAVPDGSALVTWVVNGSGGGSGAVAAARFRP